MREKLISWLIAARIKELRERHPKTEQKTTQKSLAEACGIERSTLTNIERCNQRPSIHVIYGICEYFGIDLADILPSLQSVRNGEEREVSDQMIDAELDAAIATEVMGWERRVTGRDVVGWITPDGAWRSKPEWRPSTDIADAFEALEQMRGLSFAFVLYSWHEAEARFTLMDGKYRDAMWEASAPTAPRAICEAALQAARSEK